MCSGDQLEAYPLHDNARVNCGLVLWQLYRQCMRVSTTAAHEFTISNEVNMWNTIHCLLSATLVFVAATEESMIHKTLHSFHDCLLVPPSKQVRRKLYMLMRPGIGWNTPSTVGDFAQCSRPAFFSGRCGSLLDCSCMLMFRYIRSSSDNFRLWHRKAQWATNYACTQISTSCHHCHHAWIVSL